MPVYSVVSPYLVQLNANDLTSAVRQFTKLYYRMKIEEIIVKDQMKHYRATLNYFNKNGKTNVGVKLFPHTLPVVPSTVPISTAYPGNVVRKDGTIQEYNYSPTMMVTQKVPQKGNATISMSPVMGPVGRVMPAMPAVATPVMGMGMPIFNKYQSNGQSNGQTGGGCDDDEDTLLPAREDKFAALNF